jgi:hypothetical protein
VIVDDVVDVIFVAGVLSFGAVAFHYLAKRGNSFKPEEYNVGGELVLAAIGLVVQSVRHPTTAVPAQVQTSRTLLAYALVIIMIAGAMLLKRHGYPDANAPDALSRAAAVWSSVAGAFVLAFAYFASNYSILIQKV